MKLSNIFKKNTKTVAKANVEKLEKKQLEKVIGGTTFGEKVQAGVVSATVSTGTIDLFNAWPSK
jgi:hypothetical protein